MKQLLSLLLLLAFAPSAFSHYLIHSMTPGVKIVSGSSSSPAVKGKEVKANEYLDIPNGGSVEIYNDLDKTIYKSTSSGKISVTRLLMDAKKTASDNSKNVAARLRFGKNSGDKETGEKLYVEKGVVRRSLAVFDPEADNLQIDSRTLAGKIAGFLENSDTTAYNNVNVDILTGSVDSIGTCFKVINTLDFPVYFNVLRINGNPSEGENIVEISPLGQPDGSYVLLPGQALSKESFNNLPEDENHLLVVTHVRYDLDEVVEETAKALKENGNKEESGNTIPLLIKKL